MATPPFTPVTTPVVLTTVAILVFELVHVPPDNGFVNVVVYPFATVLAPDIALAEKTFTDLVRKQPFVPVYVIVAVPSLNAVTTPELDPTEAMIPSLLCHVPPVGVVDIVIVELTQRLVDPAVIAAGIVFTVTFTVRKHPVGNL